jgi:hypothetical protein
VTAVSSYLTAATLRGLPVVAGAVALGVVREVLLDREGCFVVGFEVEDAHGGPHVLPLPASSFQGDRLEVPSRLHLVDDTAFYERRCVVLADGRQVDSATWRVTDCGDNRAVLTPDARSAVAPTTRPRAPRGATQAPREGAGKRASG